MTSISALRTSIITSRFVSSLTAGEFHAHSMAEMTAHFSSNRQIAERRTAMGIVWCCSALLFMSLLLLILNDGDVAWRP